MSDQNNPAENPYGVKVGQIWQSCDKREPYRRVTVERIEGEYAYVRWVRLSRVKLTNFRAVSTGYRLVVDVRKGNQDYDTKFMHDAITKAIHEAAKEKEAE